jgi:V/A-type H+-transporting ATPase subunit B
VQEVRALATVIGEEELSAQDKKYMEFGRNFETRFLAQDYDENRSIEKTLDIGWEILSQLGAQELDRMDPELVKKYLRKG